MFRIKEQNKIKRRIKKANKEAKQDFPEGHSAVVPPDSIPNSEVKGSDADGSVVIRHVRVGHLQGFIKETASDRDIARGFSYLAIVFLFNVIVSLGKYLGMINSLTSRAS